MSNTTPPLRSDVPEHLTWDLSTIFPTVDAWRAELAAVDAELPSLGAFEGKMVRSGKKLLEALTVRDALGQRLSRLYVFASMRHHQDTGDNDNKKMLGEIEALYHKFSRTAAYMQPEMLRIKPARIAGFVERIPALGAYAREFEALERSRKHSLPAAQEKQMSLVGQVLGGASKIRSSLSNADLRFPKVTVGGAEVELTQSNFVPLFMLNSDRGVRKAAFETMYGRLGEFGNTFASAYEASVQSKIFIARARGYDSVREMSLSSINVPVAVYDALVRTANENIGVLHRYADLRKRILGVDELHMYDLYVPLVEERKYTIEEACEMVLAAVAPLGNEYVERLRAGINARWIDWVSNRGKYGGAYSGGSYTTAPFVLMNWMGTLNDVYTLAHELGHSMHSLLTRTTQPPQTGGYTIFVAETASTVNEALLTHYLLGQAKTATERRMVINQALEGIRQTMFRQTMFAEFEMKAYALAEAGAPLTPKTLTDVYYDLNRAYFGDRLVVDDAIRHEWSRIPHFFNPFYVYQYATGISAATTIKRKILTEGKPALDAYLDMLRGGSSKDSLDLLLGAGADLRSGEPVKELLQHFGSLISEFESLL